MIPFYQRISRIIFKIFFSLSCSPLQEPNGLGLLDADGKCCLRTYLKKALVTTTDNNEFSVCFTCGYIFFIRI